MNFNIRYIATASGKYSKKLVQLQGILTTFILLFDTRWTQQTHQIFWLRN